MKILIILMLFIFILSLILMALAMMLSKKTFKDREKTSAYECGFDPKSNFRMPFSLHFYLISIIFLIFDVEITLFFPLIMTMKMTNLIHYLYISFMLIMILLIGLYHEWNQGCLNWSF